MRLRIAKFAPPPTKQRKLLVAFCAILNVFVYVLGMAPSAASANTRLVRMDAAMDNDVHPCHVLAVPRAATLAEQVASACLKQPLDKRTSAGA